jgi:hypothetical protein
MALWVRCVLRGFFPAMRNISASASSIDRESDTLTITFFVTPTLSTSALSGLVWASKGLPSNSTPLRARSSATSGVLNTR